MAEKDKDAAHSQPAAENVNNKSAEKSRADSDDGTSVKSELKGSKQKEKYMPFTEHLEELRKRLFICIGVIISFSFVAYFFSSELLDFLTKPNPGVQLQILRPTGGFIVHLKVSFFAALVFSIPVLIYQFWQFIAPGLFLNEKKYVFPVILFTILCFISGALFAYYVVLPFGLAFLLGFETESIVAQWTIDDFISFVTMMMIVFGIVFELPLVAMFLGKIGIINHAMMSQYRRYAIFGAIVFGAVLTPPDFITQLALAIPLLILYELSIVLVRITGKKSV